MAGESTSIKSPWEQILNAGSIGDGIFAGPSTSIDGTGLSTAQKIYELVEFELVVTGSPAANSIVNLYRQPNANGAGSAPTAGYKHQYVGTFTLDAASASYYIYGANLEDGADTYYIENVDAGSGPSFVLNARTKTSGPAA